MGDYNTFKNENENLIKERYLLKLAPDLSVLDYAEKYMIDHNQVDVGTDNISKLFFYNSNCGSTVTTPFKRAIFKCGSNVRPNDGIFYSFSVGANWFLICINDENISLNNTEHDYITGVCF